MLPDHPSKPFKDGFLGFMLNFTAPSMVYDHGLGALPGFKNLPPSEARAKLALIFSNNFKIATAFFREAEICNQQNELELAVFMLHQATEFVYKSFLLSLSEMETKTHKIETFKCQLEGIAPRLNAIFVNQSDEDIRLFQLLEGAYYKSVYDDRFKVSQEDFNQLKERLTLLYLDAPTIFEHLMKELRIW